MHPAYSVIVFTTASGAGYGLIIWLAIAALTGILPQTSAVVWLGFAVALALIVGGLLSSTAHLGRPERAWRAVSQWQTSWLSREGVAALVTFAPIGVLGLSLLALPAGHAVQSVAAVLTIIAALVTVYCTGMIYASLRTIPAWNHELVTPGYVLIALATGGVLYVLVTAFVAQAPLAIGWITCALLAGVGVLKWFYWTAIDSPSPAWTAEAATGLGTIGKVRQLDPPHTQANFVMREMGYSVARKHVARLRPMVLLTLCAAPMFFLALILTVAGPTAPLWAVLATTSAGLGVFVERWLFFAEAKHVVTLFYGAEAV
ncbi:MAG: DmsC/YnfH family molybdoenzyme membrane anchor subunit [Pseudomonadota bacterium]